MVHRIDVLVDLNLVLGFVVHRVWLPQIGWQMGVLLSYADRMRCCGHRESAGQIRSRLGNARPPDGQGVQMAYTPAARCQRSILQPAVLASGLSRWRQARPCPETQRVIRKTIRGQRAPGHAWRTVKAYIVNRSVAGSASAGRACMRSSHRRPVSATGQARKRRGRRRKRLHTPGRAVEASAPYAPQSRRLALKPRGSDVPKVGARSAYVYR